MLAAALAGPATSATPTPEVTLPPIPAITGLPIPSLPTDLLVPKFIGGPATKQPIAHPPIPQNPWLSPDGTNTMHNDSYASDAYKVSGPLGTEPQGQARRRTASASAPRSPSTPRTASSDSAAVSRASG